MLRKIPLHAFAITGWVALWALCTSLVLAFCAQPRTAPLDVDAIYWLGSSSYYHLASFPHRCRAGIQLGQGDPAAGTNSHAGLRSAREFNVARLRSVRDKLAGRTDREPTLPFAFGGGLRLQSRDVRRGRHAV